MSRNTPILLIATLGLAACDDFEAPCEPGRLTIVGRVQGEDLDASYEVTLFGIRPMQYLDDTLRFSVGSDTDLPTFVVGDLDAMPHKSGSVDMSRVIIAIEGQMLTSDGSDSSVEDDGRFYRLVLRELVPPFNPGASGARRVLIEPRFISGDEVHVCVGARNEE